MFEKCDEYGLVGDGSGYMVQGMCCRTGGGSKLPIGGGDILFNFSFCPKLNKFHFVQKGFLGLLYLFVLLNQMREGRG